MTKKTERLKTEKKATKETTISFRVSEDDKATLKAEADSLGMKFGEYLRYKALQSSRSSSVSDYQDLIAEISDLKSVYNQSGSKTWQYVSKGIYPEETLSIHLESKLLIRTILEELYVRLGK